MLQGKQMFGSPANVKAKKPSKFNLNNPNYDKIPESTWNLEEKYQYFLV